MKNNNENDKFKLEFKFNEDGFYIVGNQDGLMELAKIIQEVAQSDVNLSHKHLFRRWDKYVKTGQLIFDYQWIENNIIESQEIFKDVSILKSDKIGKDLWRKDKENNSK